MPDYTDLVDQGYTVTSNIAQVLYGLIDAGEQGVDYVLDQLRPLAEQADALFGNYDEPIPAPPAGGVSTTEPLTSPAEAAASVGVVPSAGGDTPSV